MADEFRITKEMMEKADTYIPIAMKEALACDVARICVKETGTIHPPIDVEPEETIFHLPPSYCESPSAKARVMMTLLLVMYLHVWDEETPLLCEAEDYDKWAGAHVLNQLERFKAGEYREKAFDILSDYREMEKYLNSAIYAVLREMNDPVTRFMSAMVEMSSSETMQNAMESIRKTQADMEAERARQEEIMRGNAGTEVENVGQ